VGNPSDYFSDAWLLADEQERIMENIIDASPAFANLFEPEYLEEAYDLYELTELEETAKRIVYLETINYIKQYLVDVAIAQFDVAAYDSKEYNYDLYVRRFHSAIQANQSEIFYIDYLDGGDIYIMIKLEALGQPEMWAEAVRAVRQEKKIGKSGDMRSHFWREKYYGVDREGKRITKEVKDKKDKKKTVTKDITERYIGKYRDTIKARLEKIPEDKAPFWYFLEYGNYNTGTIFGDGEPYPVVEPQRISDSIERTIRSLYYNIASRYEREIDYYVSRAEKKLKKAEDYYNQYKESYEDNIYTGFESAAVGEVDLENLINTERARLAQSEEAYKAAVGETIGEPLEVIVNQVRYQIEFSRSKIGKINPRVRGPEGTFIKLLKFLGD